MNKRIDLDDITIGMRIASEAWPTGEYITVDAFSSTHVYGLDQEGRPDGYAMRDHTWYQVLGGLPDEFWLAQPYAVYGGLYLIAFDLEDALCFANDREVHYISGGHRIRVQ